MKRSKYQAGNQVVVTNTYGGLIKGSVVSIADPMKSGSDFKIKVTDENGQSYTIPSKYLTEKK